MLTDEKAKYINVHNVKPGYFAVRVERAWQRRLRAIAEKESGSIGVESASKKSN